jgi:hypothetical protein
VRNYVGWGGSTASIRFFLISYNAAVMAGKQSSRSTTSNQLASGLVIPLPPFTNAGVASPRPSSSTLDCCSRRIKETKVSQKVVERDLVLHLSANNKINK